MIEVVYAVQSSFVMTEGGGGRMVHAGSHWPVSDPIVRAQPSLFSSDPRYGLEMSVAPAGFDDPPVESLTAGPGERRGRVNRG